MVADQAADLGNETRVGPEVRRGFLGEGEGRDLLQGLLDGLLLFRVAEAPGQPTMP